MLTYRATIANSAGKENTLRLGACPNYAAACHKAAGRAPAGWSMIDVSAVFAADERRPAVVAEIAAYRADKSAAA